MATPACSAAAPTSWKMLRVQAGNPSIPTTLTGPARLIALYRWRRHERLPGLWVVECSTLRAELRPEDVDWHLFPALEAQRHLIDHEERCARHFAPRSCP